MTTATESSPVKLDDDAASRYVHRWFISAHPRSDRYDIYVLRYDIDAHRTWCLNGASEWVEQPLGADMTPFVTIDEIDLNPHFGTGLGWRQVVRQAVTTAVAPLLEQLLDEKNWLRYRDLQQKATLNASVA